MGSLTKLQVHMLKTLINEPLEAFKLRKKYTRAFDYMFKYAFGKSFGVEIEINPSFYKSGMDASSFFERDTEDTKFTQQMLEIERSVKSKYKPRRYTDGPCHEYTFPVRAENLHIVYKYLKQIRNLLIGELGVGSFDTSSSMHIHLSPPVVSPKYLGIGIYHYFNSFTAQIDHDSDLTSCIEANRMLVLKKRNPSRHTKNCHMCHGCSFSIIKYIDKPVKFEAYLNRQYKRMSHIFNGRRQYDSTAKWLAQPIYRLLYLMRNGPRHAEKVYLHALELMDLKYRDKLAFLLGQYKDEKLMSYLDHSIAYFIPYMSEIRSSGITAIDGTIQDNSKYNTIEVRLFAGSTNFSTIMKRALMYNSLKTLLATSDPTLLNLFLTII